MPELRLDSVAIEYPDREHGTAFRAVDGVSFTVAPGEFVSVVGPSGCGKTSLLHAVAGLVPAVAGTISLGGEPITGPGRELAVVFQHASLLPWRTVLGNAAYGLELRRVPKREARVRAAAMVELVGLADAASRYPHELSGGMQQRVNLARALALAPAVLLMDEPFAALDAQTRDAMQAELLRIWAGSHTSVLFVTHHIEEAVFLGDRVVVLAAGPGATVREQVPVPFERPRDTALRRTPEFVALADHVWSALAGGARPDGVREAA
ncbi:ABC transporter ATP-binding protein [Micromonospora sp. CA-263727]|uniref:ABC transporter ATP-binding protein n=1 Tax=Micromonospora sp. CA-263727 TaxID=3239967 RepID=UPI003D902DBF